MIGQTLSHFRVTAKLGEGGMGEVYRAEDTKLGRDVAIKVLPEAVANDPERLARFEREAKVLAALNHSNIAAIYSIESASLDVGEPLAGPVHFLVMELVEGADLTEQIARGPLPIENSQAIALQIAEALEAAHEQGIIHRDLKPANIKVKPDGQVKVLDFGLAKALDPTAGNVGESLAGSREGASPSVIPLSMSPTLTQQMTGAGVILGTASYMSPEQAKGKVADKRADIWSFGVVLYEMLLGKRLFAAESVAETLGAIFQQDIDLDELPASTPQRLRRLLERCLDRDPKSRLRDIGEARLVLQDPTLEEDLRSTEPGSDSPSRKISVPMLLATLLIGLLLGALVKNLLQPSTDVDRAVIKTEIPNENLRATRVRHPLISPDGRRVLIPEAMELTIRDLDSLSPRPVPNSAGARYLCWSPDSKSIAFVVGLEIRRFSLEGGSPIPVAQMPNDFGGSGGMVWTVDDRLLVAGGSNSGILQVPVQGGELEEISALDEEHEVDIHELSLLPNGRDLVFVLHRRDPTGEQRLVDSLGIFANGERKEIMRLDGESLISVTYSPPGHLLFHQATSTPGVWALPFSTERLEATGAPFLVAPDTWLPSASAEGSLLLIQGLTELSSEVVEVDREGNLLRAVTRAQSEVESPDLSPDGSRVAVATPESGNWDIWIHDFERGTRTRLTFDSTFDASPRWSPTGDRILYGVADTRQIKIKQVDGASEAMIVGEGLNADWLPDESGFVFEYYSNETESWNISYKPFEEDEIIPLLASPANEVVPRLSPDGRFLLFSSDDSGTWEVMATTFPDGEKRWQISTNGGTQAQWSPTGREIFFVEGTSLMVASLVDSHSFTLTQPTSLPIGSTILSTFDPIHLSPYTPGVDGDSIFLVRSASDKTEISRLMLIQNWHREFAGGQ